ncbi:spore photoproduct lyase family protein [Arthrobacter sp. AG258]|uniref:spore photoproduct lyase family protein n=1 Tax=Arthrobacter sp. AG258 TaxID=2183899 RepID=UPI00105E8A73|nr:spore photoproduct lyase family protein [Arthrobacter sp. AG258]TDT80232.1 spore photoproduct lyase family protein [Arthrobacter sp. AG258]
MEFDRLLQVRRIYAQPEALELPRGQEIVARWPDADVVLVENHWNIPDVHGDETNVPRWSRIKTEALVLGVKKSLAVKPNGRSADFIAPSTANGCAMACAYCYVPRHKGYSNPVTVFANIGQIAGAIERHAARQGIKLEPNQCDAELWVYDIGENSDCSVDALISDNVEELVALFRELPNAKLSFATKFVNPAMLEWDHGGHTRIRFSLMPADLAKSIDVRTSPVADRMAAINDFVAAGYEVHVNFSPVIITDTWLADWEQLLRQLDATLTPEAKAQLAAEVIFLTHNEQLHNVNLGWHPQAEEVLWRPGLQEAKVSSNGFSNVRYRARAKAGYVRQLSTLVADIAPYCRIRYAF